MKPAAFEYLSPTTLAEVMASKAEHGDEAKPLAGGQSLIPAMNFRVSQPTILIDLNKLNDLRYIRTQDGELRIGAMTVQAEVARSPLVQESQPLIYETMPNIAHPQIRNRGTFGGSLAHADPASELPVIATALNARFKAESQRGERWIPADEFFITMFTTALEPDEILTEIAFPSFPQSTGYAFLEVARRAGDYAMAGLAAVVTLDEQSVCQSARLVYLNVGDKAMDATGAAALLVGEKPTSQVFEAAAQKASQEEIDPFGSVHATPEYQRHLSRVLTSRALQTAFARAQTPTS
ncbi:MAG TPA: xanthine dehydrogenase family protein subunit M [Anaerolineales bacterium]|jgi:carbon-monoxide dehydrogenase medium subunit|nr:xanthine dehydrogenase family protein subunit M [Anaerolineales bacterium]